VLNYNEISKEEEIEDNKEYEPFWFSVSLQQIFKDNPLTAFVTKTHRAAFDDSLSPEPYPTLLKKKKDTDSPQMASKKHK
jgi:hypothetical protein